MLAIAVMLPAAALAIGYLLWGEVRRHRSGQQLVSARRFRLRVAAGVLSLVVCAALFVLLFALPRGFVRAHPQAALGVGAFCLASAVAIMFIMLADVQEVETQVKQREAELLGDFARFLVSKDRERSKERGDQDGAEVRIAPEDTQWMRRALRLAARGRGHASPNPMVGAVLVRDDELVGEGYHQLVGGPHAEVWALQAAGDRARGATLYVTLEPCSHYGRTPPCVDAVLAAGVTRVVAAMEDPDPRVSGRGLARLREAGVQVEVGVLEAEVRRLNEGYLKRLATGLPFVSLKAAMSLDGKIATAAGESQWITGEQARAYGHRLRAEHDAVLTGVETVLADDAQFTVRQARGRTPRRIVADSRARTPVAARLLTADERPPVVATTEAAPEERRAALTAAGAEVWVLPARRGRVDLEALLRRAAESGSNRVLVEAGGTLAAAALAAGLVDRVYFFVAPCVIGGASARTPVEGEGVGTLAERWRLGELRARRVGEDLLVTADVVGGAVPCSNVST